MALVHIRTNADGERVQFRPDAAASFRRMERQQGRALDVNRTVVDYGTQADLYARRLRGEYPYPVAAPWLSNHVYRSDTDGGNAWDTDERGDWLDDNGWIADVAGEPWHREYRWWLDNHRNDPEPTTNNSNTNPSKEYPEMFYAVIKPKGTWYLIVPQGNDKPRAVILGANAIKGGDLPVIEFEWEGSIIGLKGAVNGILD